MVNMLLYFLLGTSTGLAIAIIAMNVAFDKYVDAIQVTVLVDKNYGKDDC